MPLKRILWLWRQRETTDFHSVPSALEPATRLRVHPRSCRVTSVVAGKQWRMIRLLFWAAFASLEWQSGLSPRHQALSSSLRGESGNNGGIGQISERLAGSIYNSVGKIEFMALSQGVRPFPLEHWAREEQALKRAVFLSISCLESLIKCCSLRLESNLKHLLCCFSWSCINILNQMSSCNQTSEAFHVFPSAACQSVPHLMVSRDDFPSFVFGAATALWSILFLPYV